MKTKTILFVCLLISMAPLPAIGWYRWDCAQNRGFEFGYFGAFNRVRHALATIPGVAITREWANLDVTLEEFGFSIATNNGQSQHLDFQESDPVRALSGQQLTAALIARIQLETSSTSAEQTALPAHVPIGALLRTSSSKRIERPVFANEEAAQREAVRRRPAPDVARSRLNLWLLDELSRKYRLQLDVFAASHVEAHPSK